MVEQMIYVLVRTCTCPYLGSYVFLYCTRTGTCVYVTGGAYVCVQKHMSLAEVSEHYAAGQRVQHETAA